MKELLKDWQIFAIDDNEDDLKLLARRLNQEGFFNLKTFTDKDRFYQELNKNVIIIIVDHGLSEGVSGLEVLKKSTASKAFFRYSIIVSGNDNGKVIQSYMNNGANYYVIKEGIDYLDEVVEYVKQAFTKVSIMINYL